LSSLRLRAKSNRVSAAIETKFLETMKSWNTIIVVIMLMTVLNLWEVDAHSFKGKAIKSVTVKGISRLLWKGCDEVANQVCKKVLVGGERPFPRVGLEKCMEIAVEACKEGGRIILDN
ncbi:unnamed protein product, partial [Meganyctiphanes norvegica]